MTSIRMHPAESRAGTSSAVQKALLATGVIASLLYVVMDMLAGLTYQGYSFYSQTISELFAVGAPKAPFLMPMIYLYSVLMVVFAFTVMREGADTNRRLVIVGTLLLAYMFAGSGTTTFPVQVRGTGTFSDARMHVLTGLVAIAVMLATMAVGATALDRRFRNFTWSMIAALVAFSALTVPFGIRLAANEPTPGMGIVERVAYYAILAWVAGLSVTLVRGTRTSP